MINKPIDRQKIASISKQYLFPDKSIEIDIYRQQSDIPEWLNDVI